MFAPVRSRTIWLSSGTMYLASSVPINLLRADTMSLKLFIDGLTSLLTGETKEQKESSDSLTKLGYYCSMAGSAMRILIIFVLTLAFSSASFAVCYTVYDKSDKAIYKSSEPPFDFSIPISEGIQSKYPGGYLITSESRYCYLPRKDDATFEYVDAEIKKRNSDPRQRNISEVSNNKVSILSNHAAVKTIPLSDSQLKIWENYLAARAGGTQQALPPSTSTTLQTVQSDADFANNKGIYESSAQHEQPKWRTSASGEGSDCIGYIGPGGPCSIGPGGGLSIGPGGGLSIGPGGGLSIGPGGGRSIGPGGGLSIGPGGGLSIGPGNNWRLVPLD